MPIEWALLGRVAFLADLEGKKGKGEKRRFMSVKELCLSISKISGEDF